MKTQAKKNLTFKKQTIVKLNYRQLNQINGGENNGQNNFTWAWTTISNTSIS